MQLYIGNKNYSSWSMRPWLLMTHFGIAFEEIRLRLDFDPDSDFKTRLASLGAAGRVPVLVDGELAVWDTLAIAEYLAETFPQKRLWPADLHLRARARSLCAEMHSGFQGLRGSFPMNIEASLPEVGQRVLAEQGAPAHDLERIVQLWSAELARSGGPFLFGGYSIADAYFAPVCSRIRTYALPTPAPVSAYVERMFDTPALRAWVRDALAEHDFLDFDEPYRKQA